MSWEQDIKSFSRTAAVDCTNSKNRFVAQNNLGQIAPVATLGANACGVLRTNPLAGNIGTVGYAGFLRVVVGAAGAVAPGQLAASDATGAAVVAATGNFILGEFLVAGNPGDIVPVMLKLGGAKA